MKIGVERLKELAKMNKDLEFICEKQNFTMDFRYIDLWLIKFLPCMIYKYEWLWRRVQLECML